MNALTLLIVLVLSIKYCEQVLDKTSKNNFNADKSMWKNEYEEELTDAVLSSRRKSNTTLNSQSQTLDTEEVLDKLFDMITSSKKYLKKVDSIDFKLNRLDIEVHEMTKSVMKQLTGLTKSIPTDGCTDKVLVALQDFRSQIKQLLGTSRTDTTGDGQEYNVDSTLESRLSSMDSTLKGVAAGVNSILTTISEVKNRQHTKPFSKSESLMSLDALNLINEFRRSVQEQKSKKCDGKLGRYGRGERYPTDCREIQAQGFNVSGIYKIKPEEMEPFYVLCDLMTVGGGWTVFQNRFDGSQDFFKTWFDYKYGFGNLAGEFWLGLEKLSHLTNQKLYELRVEMESPGGQNAFAGYSVFTVGPEHEGFRISTLGTYYGTAGDSFSYHAGQKFSTLDVDNDEWAEGACATEHGGAWWYKECDKSNLNGRFPSNIEEQMGQSIYWISFKGPNTPLVKTKMMIRPLPASRPIITDGKRVTIASNRGPNEGRIKEKSAYDVIHLPYRYGEPAGAEGYLQRTYA
ncbi:hypothetical protein ACJJTC_017839 [Scirpophaga incertulas]